MDGSARWWWLFADELRGCLLTGEGWSLRDGYVPPYLVLREANTSQPLVATRPIILIRMKVFCVTQMWALGHLLRPGFRVSCPARERS